MDFPIDSEAFLVCDYAGTSLKRGQRVIIIACMDAAVLVEVVDSKPGERIMSIPKSVLVMRQNDNNIEDSDD